MIFNLICITVFGLLWGSLILFAYRAGMKDERDRSNGITPKPNIKPLLSKKKGKLDRKEQEKYNTILQNIDSYDGTGAGQREV